MDDTTENFLDSLSPADYVNALRKVKPTAHQWDMLRLHSASLGQTMTARQLASGLGYAKWNSANLHYGKLAKKLCNVFDVVPPGDLLGVLVYFYKPPSSEIFWKLRPSVRAALTEIGVGNERWSYQQEFPLDEPLAEGARFTIQVNAFERNPVARKKCVDHYGAQCSVCEFDFGTVYGSAATGYVHVHHLVPLSSIGETYVIDPVNDLRPVCPNCHAVIHMRQPPYTIVEVKEMLLAPLTAKPQL